MPNPAPEVTALPPILTTPEHDRALRPIGAVTIVPIVSRPIPALASEGRNHTQHTDHKHSLNGAARPTSPPATEWTPETIARTLDGQARQTSKARGRWSARCPAHDDDSPSLDIENGRSGIVYICRAGCSQADVTAALEREGITLGKPSGDAKIDTSGNIIALQRRGFRIAAEYDYTDAYGVVLYQNVKLEMRSGGKRLAKTFRQRRPGPNSGWIENLDGVTRIPYRLRELIASTGDVHATEGEKDADLLAGLGLSATSIADPKTTDLSALAGRTVIVHADNDAPGRAKAVKLAEALAGIAAAVAIIHYTDTPEKGDVSDWLDAGRGLGDLMARVAAAKPVLSVTVREPQPQQPTAPDMSIVQRTVAPAPVLDLAAFGPLATWIKQSAESKAAPSDYVAMALLGGVAGTIGASRWVSPWSGWREPAIVWAMLVGSPSASKSPAMDAMRDPLAVVEREVVATWPETRRAYDTAKTIADAHREKWEADVHAAVNAAKSEPLMPAEAETPTAPQMPRIVITDATIESAASILAGNTRGLVLWRDECSAWLANLGKYGDGDRAFWLETYGGRSYVVDRKKLPEPLRIEHMAVSIVGGIQPDRLATLLMSGDDDGLAARFAYVWPESVPPSRPRHRPDTAVAARALRRMHALALRPDAETGEARPVTLPVEPAALEVWEAWREHHHADSQSASGLMASALGKMPGQALRLALVLELLWWAAGPDGAAEPSEVSGKSLGAALELIEGYFKPMLVRVLGEAALPLVDRHAAVLGRAIQGRRASVINLREVRRDWRLPGLREAGAVAAAIGALEEGGWLKAVGGRDGGSAGRQRGDYVVDPRVHGRAS